MDTQSDHQENKHSAEIPTSNQIFGLSPEQALKPGNNKKKLIIACVALAVLLVGSLTWAFLGQKDAPSQTTSEQQAPRLGAAVTLIDGAAKISQNGGAWTPLSTDIVPQQDDTIATDPASRVIITLDDGSIIRLDESSTVKLASLDQNDIHLDNELGDVYTRVVASERKFTVSVDGTGYTALGTAFKTVNETTNKGVQVLQSSVSVEGVDTKVDEGKQFFKAHASADLTDKITDVSVEELKSDGFMIWNLEQDEKEEAFKDKLGYLAKIKEQAASAPDPAPAGASIKLTATTSEKGVVLKWTVSGISGNKGFKVVRSKKTTSPTFGKDEANYADGASARSLTWKDGSGITYNYRVCAYYGDSCGTYSNTVTIASPYTPPEPVVSGPVTLTMTGNVASWTFGGTAPHGFKVLVGTSSGPTYGNSYKTFYTGDTSKEIEGLDAGTYYVRVCKYTADSNISGGCTDYSNEETLNIP